MAKNPQGQKITDMPEAYQERLKEQYGENAGVEFAERQKAYDNRFEKDDDRSKAYGVKNLDQFVDKGFARQFGAGGASEGKQGRNRVSARDFKELFKARIKEDGTVANKVQQKSQIVDFADKIGRTFDSPEDAGYGGKAARLIDRYRKDVADFDNTSDQPKQSDPTPSAVNTGPGAGSTGNTGQNASTAGTQTVSGRGNVVTQDNSITQDQSRYYGGDTRIFNASRGGTDDLYNTDTSQAAVGGFFDPSYSPSSTQRFLDQYMDGLPNRGSSPVSMADRERKITDNSAAFKTRADEMMKAFAPNQDIAKAGITMPVLPEEEKDRTAEIYKSVGIG